MFIRIGLVTNGLNWGIWRVDVVRFDVTDCWQNGCAMTRPSQLDVSRVCYDRRSVEGCAIIIMESQLPQMKPSQFPVRSLVRSSIRPRFLVVLSGKNGCFGSLY
jgi:hypothetical protein